MMSSEDRESLYSRHFLLSEVGFEGQAHLQKAKILCVGAGGTASAFLMYLVAAGIGAIDLVDGDEVALSNLHRQILYARQDVGRSKVLCAYERLSAFAGETKIRIFHQFFEKGTDFLDGDYDVVVDCCDQFDVKYALNDFCLHRSYPFLHTGALGFQGRYGFFNVSDGGCLRCMFPVFSGAATCESAGVLGVVPGVVGTLAASLLLQLILGFGNAEALEKFYVFDACSHGLQNFYKRRDPSCVCRKSVSVPLFDSSSLTVTALQEALDTYIFVDVRSLEERQSGFIDAPYEMHSTMPLSREVCDTLRTILSEQSGLQVVVYCHRGLRSKGVSRILSRELGCRVWDLSGGFQSWLNHGGGKKV